MQNNTSSSKQQSLFLSVYTYYFENITELTFDEAYHFCNRLWLWSGDKNARKYLDKIRKKQLSDENIPRYLEDKYAYYQKVDLKNSRSLREKYFKTHKDAVVAGFMFLEALQLETIYGINARPILNKYIKPDEAHSLYIKLWGDKKATAILSTYAVNFLYLYKVYYKEETIDSHTLLKCLKFLDINKPEELIIYIYFITHCIIGESLFYSKLLEKKVQKEYQKELLKINNILQNKEKFLELHSDVKFETLVVSKICNFKLSSEIDILREAKTSLSEHGDYIIDRHTISKQNDYATFGRSEHRNVLFLMSHIKYNPMNNLNKNNIPSNN